jgi:hypothetical protein
VHQLAQRTEAARRLARLLGRVGAHLPADVAAALRTRLAAGHLAEVAHAVVFAAVARTVTLTDPDVDLLIATLAGHGEGTAMAEAINRA